jgi:S-adenosylmethionine decarboxylase
MNGIEWVVDAQGCDAETLRRPDLLQGLFDQIIKGLRLRPLAETQWHQFPNTGGITGFCLLSESHLACHTFPEFGSLCLNLFCCVPREAWNFEETLASLFGATSVNVRTVSRPYGPTDGSSPKSFITADKVLWESPGR